MHAQVSLILFFQLLSLLVFVQPQPRAHVQAHQGFSVFRLKSAALWALNVHALVQRIYPWPQLRMLYRIGYPHCQCEVRDGDVKALYIRDRISRTHSIIHGELHAQDSDLHKLHARSHEHNHHHV